MGEGSLLWAVHTKLGGVIWWGQRQSLVPFHRPCLEYPSLRAKSSQVLETPRVTGRGQCWGAEKVTALHALPAT